MGMMKNLDNIIFDYIPTNNSFEVVRKCFLTFSREGKLEDNYKETILNNNTYKTYREYNTLTNGIYIEWKNNLVNSSSLIVLEKLNNKLICLVDNSSSLNNLTLELNTIVNEKIEEFKTQYITSLQQPLEILKDNNEIIKLPLKHFKKLLLKEKFILDGSVYSEYKQLNSQVYTAYNLASNKVMCSCFNLTSNSLELIRNKFYDYETKILDKFITECIS